MTACRAVGPGSIPGSPAFFMSLRSHEKKKKQLGESTGAASHRLVKNLLFEFVKDKLCFRCGKPLTRDTFSIDHKTPWLDSHDPVGLFFDLDNIAFSHFACNVREARQPAKARSQEERLSRRALNNKQYRKNQGPELMREQRRAKYLRTGT